jgi:hypothetical protein
MTDSLRMIDEEQCYHRHTHGPERVGKKETTINL